MVLILSVMDDIAEIRRLPELLTSIPAAEGKQFAPLTLMPDMPEAVLTPRQAAMAEEILVPLDRAEGKIAAAAVGLYPPGIPLICPGERYSREMLELMRQYKADGCEFHGPSDASLEVLYVLKEE